jgi:nucleotide-binding universal stress UspA family protein
MGETATPGRLSDGIHFRRLLVAVDGSPHSDLAVAAAVSIALRERALLTLIAVSGDVSTNPGPWVAYIPPAVAQADNDQIAQRHLDQALALIPEQIGVRTVLARGRPGPAIAQRAASGDYDAVLMGARGLGKVRAAIGSVSQYVMHHAPITVLTAHQPPPVDTEPIVADSGHLADVLDWA